MVEMTTHSVGRPALDSVKRWKESSFWERGYRRSGWGMCQVFYTVLSGFCRSIFGRPEPIDLQKGGIPWFAWGLL